MNPYNNADVITFIGERHQVRPLRGNPFTRNAATYDGEVLVWMNGADQTECWINGRKTERFSVKWRTRRG